jgi:signal transduction histidine kinase
MTINEVSTPVNIVELNVLLPTATLATLIEPFESLLNLRVGIFYPDGAAYYGLEVCRQAEVPIVVDHLEIGLVRVCGSHDDTGLYEAAAYLANTLSLLAVEVQRRRTIGDEVLARYDELNLIYDLATVISNQTLTQVEVVQRVLDETNRILRAEAGAIYVHDDANDELDPVHHFGHEGNEQFWMGHTRELALSTLYAYETTQLFEDGRVICAPLRHNDQRLGALVLIHESSERVFNANDVNLLTTLSHNTALFIQTARLIDTLGQRNQELTETLEALRAARDELSRTERLSIIGQTIGGLVHDMRKPLSNVMGYAGLLQEPDLSDAERQEYAAQIIGFINAFSSMAQEILDYTHGDDEHIDRAKTDVGEYMRFIESRLKPPGLQLSVEVEFDVSAAQGRSIFIDQQRFMRVFQNLVNNAIDAIEDHRGSRVVLSVAPTDDHMIQFVIADDGPGIPMDKVDTMFEPLITTKAHGTGLGLAIVKRMVTIHGGDIHYETSAMGGASFVFTVPEVT